MILVKEDIFRKRPILGNRILTPVRDDKETTPPVKVEPKQSSNSNEDIFRKPSILGHRISIPPQIKPSPKPSPEPSPMDLAMEEIRAAQKQREEQARKFEEMMSGSFAAAFPQNISQEMADMIAAFKLQGMSDEQATNIARQKLGE